MSVPPPLRHGKSCPRCAASKKTSRPSLGPCPLVGLSDTKKGAKPRSPKKAGVKSEDEESEAEESDLTDEDEGEVKEEVKEEGEEEEAVVASLGEGGVISQELKDQQQKDIEEAVRVAHGG